MSDQPEHLDPKEATEAKLCAYLEGELPPSERAEIEQHLAANPQHRKLLADLAHTRDWVRSIPREYAPSDLAESFQGQMERTMLLNDAGDAGTGMSMTRWPQYAMVAAIIVLVLGLGVTLVVILKGPSQLPVAISGPAGAATKPTELPTPADALVKSDRLVPPAPAANVAPVVVAATPPAPTSPPAVAAGTLDVSADKAIAIPSAPASQAADAEQIKTRLAAAGYRVPADAKTICFVVRSDSPAVTAGQVHDFFTRHQLLVEQPANLALPGNQQMQTFAYAENKSKENNTQNPAAPSSTTQNSGPGAANNAQNNGTTANPQQQNSPQLGTVANNTPNSGDTNLGKDAAAETVYVGHGLTPLQLALLNASLAENNPNQPVNRFTLSEGMSLAQRAPVPGSVIKGQTLTVTIPQLVGPGIEKTNLVKVADDGSISLPMIDPLQAVGITPGELEQRIAAKYREANLIPDAKVTITAGPSTQPTSLPATQPLAAAPATQAMQPDQATPATQPTATGINVVVVIEKPPGR
jgi:anti-sigma factor RsiW